MRPRLVITWGPDAQADGAVSDQRPEESQFWWFPVKNPFGLAQEQNQNVRHLLETAPAQADEALARLQDDVRSAVGTAVDNGADGVAYLVMGATAAESTPMEFGGHWLELDRGLLQEITCPVLVYVVGDREPYIDFVSDLHGALFGFNPSSFPVVEARALRSGLFALADPAADVFFVDRFATAEPWLNILEVPA